MCQWPGWELDGRAELGREPWDPGGVLPSVPWGLKGAWFAGHHAWEPFLGALQMLGVERGHKAQGGG